MANNRHLLFFILIFYSTYSFAQKTTLELGNIVFAIFKNNNFKALDTLTPKSSEIIEILKKNIHRFQWKLQIDFWKNMIIMTNASKNDVWIFETTQ